jgi:NAD(P)-dependent dehydrogenase (short-subunit alcohol dehydrogenase family)
MFSPAISSQRLLDNAEMAQAVVSGIPLQRPGEPEDVAGAVIYLTSRAGSYVTGETILVDGGRTNLSGPQASPGSGLPPSMVRDGAPKPV